MSSFRVWMLDREWCWTCLFRTVLLGQDDVMTCFTLLFLRNAAVALDALGHYYVERVTVDTGHRKMGASSISISLSTPVNSWSYQWSANAWPMQRLCNLTDQHCHRHALGTMHLSLYFLLPTVRMPSFPKTVTIVSSHQSIGSRYSSPLSMLGLAKC